MSSATEPAAPVMRRLGDFILLEEIGRGGMGKVFHARQVSLEREVALKVLPAAAGLDADSVIRFKREAEAAGRLAHPGIVPIYAVGEVDDVYFYAMERIEGPSLDSLLESLGRRGPATLRRPLLVEAGMNPEDCDVRLMTVPSFLAGSAYAASCATMIMELTGALTAAHQGQVIHRDVKPSNILLRPSGRPVIVDFGLARDQLALSMTQTGEAVGTPVYMSPEQASGSRVLDGRVDVYGLGATLYEMLTLQSPFDGETAAEVMRAIIEEEPVPPRKLNPRVPRALETIVLKCLAKNKHDRYPTTKALGDDLSAFLAGHEIRARPAGLGVRILGRLRRNRRSAWVALCSVLFALVVGMTIGLFSFHNTRQGGFLALDNAKVLLIEGRVREAHAAYVQAQILLEDPELVAHARLENFAAVFPAMYANKRYRVLDEFLKTLPPEDLDWPEYHEFRLQLEGMGHVRLLGGALKDVQVGIRSIEDGEFDPEWSWLPRDGRLRVGSYLIRLRQPGMASVVRAIEVQRDAEVVLDPQFKPISRIPEAMALVAPADGGALFAVDRTEVTVGKYADLLNALNDPQLAAELEPVEWDRAARERPVTGLSFRQARTVAALLGGHLLSREEYRYAATGGLRELMYPWGRKFDLDRVVGDPQYTSMPGPVGSKPKGASPNGILDLVGNAAEMLAAERDGNLFVAGGHYASNPRDLSVESFERLPGVDDRSPFYGMRVARFLAVEDDGKANGRVEARIDELARSNRPYVISRWSLSERGRMELSQTFVLSAGAPTLHLPELTGFRRQELTARDSSGHELRLEDLGAEGVRLQVPRRPGPVRLTVTRVLEPLSGLYGRLDSYLLHLPFADRDHPEIHRVELPAGSHVDEVWPVPDEMFSLDGAPVLIWQRDSQAVKPFRCATVRLRRDGFLTDRWAALAPVQKVVEELFAALAAGEAARLDRLLADDCRLWPQDWNKARILAGVGTLPGYSAVRVTDLTTVGDILTVELRVTLRTAGAPGHGWPMRLQLRRSADPLQVVGLGPSNRFDLGGVEGGAYSHPRLRVELTPDPGSRITRLVEHLTELQLEVCPLTTGPGPADHGVILLGCIDGSGSQKAVREQLTAGADRWRAGERRDGAGIAPIAIPGEGRMERSDEHWMFTEPGGGATREWWVFRSLGNRHFLARCIAIGATAEQAESRFAERESWFRALLAGLRVR